MLRTVNGAKCLGIALKSVKRRSHENMVQMALKTTSDGSKYRTKLLTTPFSMYSVSMTMTLVFCSHTMRQKSTTVLGSGA